MNHVLPSRLDKPLSERLQHIMMDRQDQNALSGGAVMVMQNGVITGLACAGHTGNEHNDPWAPDTLSLNFSTGKGVLSTLVHALVSKGLLSLETAIAHYWPKFGQNGKAHITLKEVLTHTAGLFDIQAITVCNDDILDWALMQNRVEQMTVATPSNIEAASCYSALVSGWVLGTVIEQVTNQSLNAALDTYLAKPLGMVGQMRFGIDRQRLGRIAKVPQRQVTRADAKATCDAYARLPSYACWQQLIKTDAALTTSQIARLYLDLRHINRSDYRRALTPSHESDVDYFSDAALLSVIPAANAVASCQALVTMYAMLANGGIWQDHVVITPQVISKLSRVYVTKSDAVMPAAAPIGQPSMLWRLGYHKVFSRCHAVPDGFGHMGYNGSTAWCDPKRRLAMAYVHNHGSVMTMDIRQFALTEAVLHHYNDEL